MPNTIAENLQRLIVATTAIGNAITAIGNATTAIGNAITAIGNAITAKGGTVNEGDGLEEFPDDIMSIPQEPVIYGFHIKPNESDSSTAVSYLKDAVDMTPAAMGASTFNYGSWENAFFMPKPCMLKSDGTVDYYLDENDYTKKADGTPSDIANPDYDGNAMMEWGMLWYKFENGETDGEGYFYVSNREVDKTYRCWCNIDSKNNVTPHFYTAIYNGTGTTNSAQFWR